VISAARHVDYFNIFDCPHVTGPLFVVALEVFLNSLGCNV